MSAEMPRGSFVTPNVHASWDDGQDFWREGLDRMFFTRCYKTSAVLGAIVAIAAILMEQRAVAFGISAGVGMGLFSTWTLEMTARLLFNGGGFAGLKLGMAAFVKMPIMLAFLAFIAWAANTGVVNAFGVIGGILLVHTTMMISVISTAVRNQDKVRERYR